MKEIKSLDDLDIKFLEEYSKYWVEKNIYKAAPGLLDDMDERQRYETVFLSACIWFKSKIIKMSSIEQE